MECFFTRALTALSVVCVAANVAGATEPNKLPDHREFSFTYHVSVEAPPAGQGPVEVFVPLAHSNEHQEVLERKIAASIPGKEEKEARFNNEFWHGHLDASDGKPITVDVTYKVNRHTFSRNLLEVNRKATYSAEEKKQYGEYLKADSLVPVSGELIEKVRKDLPKSDPDPLSRAKAIYNYVVDTMEYKKVGTGWGNGDTAWACSQRYGNCTDFHSLFISLARAEGIPAKFEIGFSIPTDQPEGTIAGYHCWAEFYLPKTGWVPVDASEAKKHPEMRETFFGTHPADRFQLTVGRDIQLSAAQKTKPLNYFLFPHVEVNGEKWEKIEKAFSFKQL